MFDAIGLYYKTFYGLNLRIFVIRVFVPFQPSLLFVGEAGSLPLSGAPERLQAPLLFVSIFFLQNFYFIYLFRAAFYRLISKYGSTTH